jgi:hypothetical protein
MQRHGTEMYLLTYHRPGCQQSRQLCDGESSSPAFNRLQVKTMHMLSCKIQQRAAILILKTLDFDNTTTVSTQPAPFRLHEKVALPSTMYAGCSDVDLPVALNVVHCLL